MVVLLNNYTPNLSVLGMIHSINQTTLVLFWTLGPVCTGHMFGVSFEYRAISAVWWIIAIVAICG